MKKISIIFILFAIIMIISLFDANYVMAESLDFGKECVYYNVDSKAIEDKKKIVKIVAGGELYDNYTPSNWSSTFTENNISIEQGEEIEVFVYIEKKDITFAPNFFAGSYVNGSHTEILRFVPLDSAGGTTNSEIGLYTYDLGSENPLAPKRFGTWNVDNWKTHVGYHYIYDGDSHFIGYSSKGNNSDFWVSSNELDEDDKSILQNGSNFKGRSMGFFGDDGNKSIGLLLVFKPEEIGEGSLDIYFEQKNDGSYKNTLISLKFNVTEKIDDSYTPEPEPEPPAPLPEPPGSVNFATEFNGSNYEDTVSRKTTRICIVNDGQDEVITTFSNGQNVTYNIGQVAWNTMVEVFVYTEDALIKYGDEYMTGYYMNGLSHDLHEEYIRIAKLDSDGDIDSNKSVGLYTYEKGSIYFDGADMKVKDNEKTNFCKSSHFRIANPFYYDEESVYKQKFESIKGKSCTSKNTGGRNAIGFILCFVPRIIGDGKLELNLKPESCPNSQIIIEFDVRTEVTDGYSGIGYKDHGTNFGVGNFDDYIANVGNFTPSSSSDGIDRMETTISKILSAITNIGIIVTAIMSAVLGVKYMLGSVEEKAEYKKDLIPYLIGSILLFGVCTFVKILQSLGNSINNI